MNALLLAFLVNFPINNTWDPAVDYLPYGEEIIIKYIDVKPIYIEYELEEYADCCLDHIEQLEDLEEEQNGSNT